MIKTNVTAAVPVQVPVTKVLLISLTEKAELVREHFCDGLGDCLPECPTGAILLKKEKPLNMMKKPCKKHSKKTLQNWPVQIKLAPANAPYFNDAKLLIAADCTAYAYASFHQDLFGIR